MKKQLIIIGIIVILITVGLSGCNEIGLTNIGDLSASPQNYLGKEVRVKGNVVLMVGIGSITDEQGHSFAIKYTTMTTLTGNYYLTGIVEHNSLTGYYLDVTKADAV
ncbi:MAG: DUF3316 domain-containing protein [Candidatus Thermoplasmatota archaeon]|nr:DUF3316 domain-containing protein [Candidatus Thermoplasmatota archaeon]